MRAAMLQPAAWEEAVHATYLARHVLVLPAFETRAGLELGAGAEVARRAAEGGKAALGEAFAAGDVVQFAPFYARGHGATNYTRWFASAEGYPIEPERGYEPFVLVSRLHVPWFDERFRGYGWDKITHIFHMLSTGFTLVAHPSAWVVHRPHAPSSAYNRTFTGPAYTKKHKPTQELKKLDGLAKEMMAQVRDGSYPRFGVTALAGCRPLGMFSRAALGRAELEGRKEEQAAHAREARGDGVLALARGRRRRWLR
jgi:glycosyltransferase-like protein LARGE